MSDSSKLAASAYNKLEIYSNEQKFSDKAENLVAFKEKILITSIFSFSHNDF